MTADHPLFEMPRLPLMEDELVIEDGDDGDKGFDQTDLTVRYTDRAVSFIRENTVIMFASDNAPWQLVLDMAADAYGSWSETSDGTTGSAVPLRGWKNETLEGGPRVPLLVRWPGRVPAGIVNDVLATNMDILPTIAELLEAAERIDADISAGIRPEWESQARISGD